jgi:hypothetical protein
MGLPCCIIERMEEYEEVDEAILEMAPSIVERDAPSIPDVATTVAVVTSRDKLYGQEVKEAAQMLHTQVYLDKGYIDAADIDARGIFSDKYSSRSTYLLSENEYRRSACRYISADKKDGILSLPTAEHFSIDPAVIQQVAGINRLSDLKHREVIEVSGLASLQMDPAIKKSGRREELDATRLLYASIIRHSLDEGHKVWLLNIDEKLLRSLEILIGNEQVHRLGKAHEYMGPSTVPVAINPQEVVRAAFADESDFGDMKRQYLLESLPGVRSKHLPKDIKELLTEHNIPYEEEAQLRRLLTNRRALGYAGIIGYSSGRVLLVGDVEEFHGSIPLLWAIDVGTAVPYTWGLIETVSAKTPVRRAVGATVASGSFVAPYAYFWAEGQDYPPYVNAVVGGLIGTATLFEVVKARKDRKIARRLKAPDTSLEK